MSYVAKTLINLLFEAIISILIFSNRCQPFCYRHNGVAFTDAVFGDENGTIWLENVTCSSNDHHILNCSRSAWGATNSNFKKSVGVWCTSKAGKIHIYIRLHHI